MTHYFYMDFDFNTVHLSAIVFSNFLDFSGVFLSFYESAKFSLVSML